MKPISLIVEDIINEAIDKILQAMVLYKAIVIGYSGGKDSSVLLSLTLRAFDVAMKRGMKLPHLIVHTNNTGVENPEIRQYVKSEFQKISDYCLDRGIPCNLSVGYPTLTDHWAVSILCGRKLPTYPDKKTADCSVDYKIKPGAKSMKMQLAKIGLKLSDALILLGTRFDESTKRKMNMEARGESSTTVAKNAQTGDSLAPVADWDDTDIWTYIQLIMSGNRSYSDGSPFTTYSDFEQTWKIYADATDSGCHVFGSTAPQTGCGARHGCWSCAKVLDNASLRIMIQNDDEYGYMKNALRVQQFIVNSQYDWEQRNPISRSINPKGFMVVQPDVLHPNTIEKIFIACLTIDRDSHEEEYRLGLSEQRIEQILSLERIAYIDAIWSMRGFFEPYHAWNLVQKVYSGEMSFYFPEDTPRVPKTPQPAKRYLDLRDSYASVDESERFKLWSKSRSVREGCIFLDDEDIYDISNQTERDNLSTQVLERTLNTDDIIDHKLGKSITVNTENLALFLEEKAGLRLKFNHPSGLEPVKGFAKSTTRYGWVEGFKSYLDYGVLRYNKSQKRWIENSVQLTLSRVKTLGQWGIPTYSELINKTAHTLNQELPDILGKAECEMFDEPLLYDFSELDVVNNTFTQTQTTVKKKRVSESISTDLHNQMTMMF